MNTNIERSSSECNDFLNYLNQGLSQYGQGDVSGAILSYQQAIQINPSSFKAYRHLGDAFFANKNWEDAALTYKKAVAIRPNSPRIFLQLSRSYRQQKMLEPEIQSCRKALQLCPNVSIDLRKRLEVALAENGCYSEAAVLRRWRLLNECSMSLLDEDENVEPVVTDEIQVAKYFAQICRYKIVDLLAKNSASVPDIEASDLKIHYLEDNRFVVRSDRVDRDTQVQRNLDLKDRRALDRVIAATEFQIPLIVDACIYAVCPWTGQIISSNQSFPLIDGTYFYRFLGKEVFYLIIGEVWAEKVALYFPQKELIVCLINHKINNKIQKSIELFKFFMVASFEKVKLYIKNKIKSETAVVTQNFHFGHHIWNELSAISKLEREALISKVDKFLICAEPIGLIEEIYPEISKDKIERMRVKDIFYKVLEYNYFVASIGHCFITENLANRIHKSSLVKCEPSLLETIEDAQKNNFPLFWISLRLGSRTWISQIEGLAKIVESLYSDYPKIGLVIDGFSLPENTKNLTLEHKQLIEEEKKTAQELISLIPSDVSVYNLVGCKMHENIIWSHAVDFYLAHQGSLQHKVGWIANKPGVVHTNKFILENRPISIRPGCWERENGIIPTYVHQKYVTDIDQIEHVRGRQTAAGNTNYECEWEGVYHEALKLAKSLEKRIEDLGIGNQ